MKRFRAGLVFKAEAHGIVYHSTLGWRVIKKKLEGGGVGSSGSSGGRAWFRGAPYLDTLSLLRHTLLLPGHTLLLPMHTLQLTRHTLCAIRSCLLCVSRFVFCVCFGFCHVGRDLGSPGGRAWFRGAPYLLLVSGLGLRVSRVRQGAQRWRGKPQTPP